MTYRIPIFSSFLLALALLLQQSLEAAPPKKVIVTGAVPNEAKQGQMLPVVISGENFDAGSTARFLVSGTNDDSQIDVGTVVYNPDGTLTADIQVRDDAQVLEYDIEVRTSSGRRGKGTSLFSVKQKPGEVVTITCDEYFGLADGTCTAENSTDDCLLTPLFNSPGWQFTRNCDTRAMLVTPIGLPFLNGQGFRLNLVAPWSGDYAGISNSQGRVRIDGIHVHVDDPLVAGGCGLAGGVQTALLIDPDQPDPADGTGPNPVAANITVSTSNGALFCNAMEHVGSDPSKANREFRAAGSLEANVVGADSYERAGIWVADQNLNDTATNVAGIWHNIVNPSSAPCAVGILVAAVERAGVSDNEVYASTGDVSCGKAAAIVISDSGRNRISPDGPDYDYLGASPVNVIGNVIHSGGSLSGGIAFDADTSAATETNAVSAGDPSDFGFCVENGADVDIPNKRNFRNSFVGFAAGNEIVQAPDCGVAVP